MGGGIVLDITEEERLVELCKAKTKTWFDQVKNRSDARVLMLNSILVRNLFSLEVDFNPAVPIDIRKRSL